MIDAELTSFLQSGCSTIVGFVRPSGEPFAARGWGIRVLGPDRLRLLIGAADLAELGIAVGDGACFAIAVTGANVRTLRSVQLKGTAHDVEPVTDDDRARSARFCEEFFTDVYEVDGIGKELMHRLVPADLLACTVDVAEAYDQTPGPAAGAPLPAPAP